MEAILEIKLEIDKSEWKPVKFGDVVKEPKESIKDPVTAGVEYVVGLEHIEPEDIHLRSFNTLEESTTFTKAFKKGDILFGRRRAYLKKAAMAEFGGICSGDITVFRAKENLLPELLPFIVNNDKFFDWAVKHSAGGLSPRVKFKDLAKFVFLLPPKGQQAGLTELLWAMDEVVESEIKLLNKTEVIKEVKEKEYLFGEFVDSDKKKTEIGYIPNNWKLEKLSNISWFQEGPGLRNWQFKEEGIKVINITNLVEGNLDLSKTKRHISWEEFNKSYKHFECQEDDIVIASSGNSYCKHAIIRKKDLPLMMNTSVIRFQPLAKVSYNFLNQFLKSKIFKRQIDILITGAAQPNFGPSHLEKLLIPMPENMEIQEKIGDNLLLIDNQIEQLKEKIVSSKLLMKSIINQIF